MVNWLTDSTKQQSVDRTFFIGNAAFLHLLFSIELFSRPNYQLRGHTETDEQINHLYLSHDETG